LPVGHAARGVHLFKHLDALSARAEHGLAKKRDLVSDWMTKRQDLAWSAPEHGLFGFAVRTKAPATDDLRARIERGQRDRHVLVVPGSFFGVPQGFRLAWSLPEERLTDALRRLAEVLDRPA
jgi:aspartate/methionine/tyrosine aminotransferase